MTHQRVSAPTTRLGLLGIAIACALASSAAAQQVEVRTPRGPQFTGAPIEITLLADGFEESPQPEAQVPAPETGRLDLVGVEPQVSSQITIVNGRVQQQRTVRHVFRYRYVASAAGRVHLGPFTVSQGGTSRGTGPVAFDVRDVPKSDRVAVEVKLPAGPLYVGQRVPVVLEFAIARELQEKLQSYSLQVPLFDLTGSFRFSDPDQDRRKGDEGVDVRIQTSSGRLDLRGRVRERREARRRLLVVSVERLLVPLRPGRFEVPAATIVADEGTRFTRDLFGGRRATHVRKLRASDEIRTLEVRDLPAEERPASFAGAVGSGYQLEVAADRTVVQVGEPITLTLTLRGDGSLETAGLPPLNAPGLLPARDFRAPPRNLAGTLEEGGKRFEAVVRVLDDGVKEVPALEYAWFDTKAGRYQTTRSRPVALSVRAADVVGAAEVFRDEVEGESPAEETEDEPARRETTRVGSLALTGADLAIERNVDRLLRPPGVDSPPWLAAGLYGGSLLALGLAWRERRRRDVPAEVRERARLLSEARATLQGVAARPGEDTASEIARALRKVAAELPEARGAELDALLVDCDSRSYAPGAADADASLAERALERLDAFDRAGRR